MSDTRRHPDLFTAAPPEVPTRYLAGARFKFFGTIVLQAATHDQPAVVVSVLPSPNCAGRSGHVVVYQAKGEPRREITWSKFKRFALLEAR